MAARNPIQGKEEGSGIPVPFGMAAGEPRSDRRQYVSSVMEARKETWEIMTAKDELLKTRFMLNTGRTNDLVRLLNSTEALKSTGLFRSEGARADILRSIVVFLHATFEDVLPDSSEVQRA